MRYDCMVLGGGIIGTSVALHLEKKGFRVALVDRRNVGEETSYGNAGVIEGSTVFPPAFPSDFGKFMRVVLKRSPNVNYHWSHLPKVLPWIFAFWRASRPRQLVAYAHLMRPLFAHAVQEHEALLKEARAMQYLRKNGWLKLYRNESDFSETTRERHVAQQLGISYQHLTATEACALEPHLCPKFKYAIHCADSANLTNPLAITRAYAKHFEARGGKILKGDARSLARIGNRWSIITTHGAVVANNVIVALGPWTPDVINLFGIHLPMTVKRGYHYHFRQEPERGVTLTRPTMDADIGYYLTPMEQGIRMTTGAEFASRDAAPTPVQFGRIMPHARQLLPLGSPIEERPWMGCRPCFPDSRPIIGRAPGRMGTRNMWLACGHAHWGMTLGPVTGRLIAEMLTGDTPFCDPAPYRAERFL